MEVHPRKAEVEARPTKAAVEAHSRKVEVEARPMKAAVVEARSMKVEAVVEAADPNPKVVGVEAEARALSRSTLLQTRDSLTNSQ